MMKKKILLILFIVFCVWPLLWATWEGNGGIGAASDFPANGLFVKSDMFPNQSRKKRYGAGSCRRLVRRPRSFGCLIARFGQ